ncbi:unnamed protein product [marine sediment metagenome]|uniref:Uncharacterized protein n=1 Tax=marine sediment metagenome TaxID=412755 RepID=X1MT04_9ZZZZ
MPILDYTTKVPVSRTIAQIEAKLVEHGARAVMKEYGDDGRIKALSFNVKMPNGELPIRMPIDTAATLRVLKRQWDERLIESKYTTEEHAYRVAFRIVKDWIEAQMSLLETEMVRMEEIFLPYVITPGGQTIYQVMAKKGFLLGPGEKDEHGD